MSSADGASKTTARRRSRDRWNLAQSTSPTAGSGGKNEKAYGRVVTTARLISVCEDALKPPRPQPSRRSVC
eukprot:883646-Rhodomonas_salina.1